MVVNPAFDLSQTAAAPSSNSRRSPSPQLHSADLDQLHWAPLPGTQKEGEAIAQLTDAVLLAQQQVSAAAVQQSPAAPLLHISTHGFFLPDQSQPNNNSSSRSGTPRLDNPMLRSGIDLAGANQASQRSCRAFINASKTERDALRLWPAPRPNSAPIPLPPGGIHLYGLLFNSAATGGPSPTSEHQQHNKAKTWSERLKRSKLFEHQPVQYITFITCT